MRRLLSCSLFISLIAASVGGQVNRVETATRMLQNREAATQPTVDDPSLKAQITELEARIQRLEVELETLRERFAVIDAKPTIERVGTVAARESTPATRPVVQERSVPSSISGGTVQVKGYYRKDGTYVRPYTRRK